MAAIESIPSTIYEAAYIDGASRLTVITRITLPLMKPIIQVNTLLIAVGAMKFFDLIYTMTSGGPDHSTEVLASHIYTRSFQMLDYGYGDALSLVLLAICLILSLIIYLCSRTEKYEF
jgi:raffinose/stachyose/melibiose transport system permease protein